MNTLTERGSGVGLVTFVNYVKSGTYVRITRGGKRLGANLNFRPISSFREVCGTLKLKQDVGLCGQELRCKAVPSRTAQRKTPSAAYLMIVAI